MSERTLPGAAGLPKKRKTNSVCHECKIKRPDHEMAPMRASDTGFLLCGYCCVQCNFRNKDGSGRCQIIVAYDKLYDELHACAHVEKKTHPDNSVEYNTCGWYCENHTVTCGNCDAVRCMHHEEDWADCHACGNGICSHCTRTCDVCEKDFCDRCRDNKSNSCDEFICSEKCADESESSENVH